jgi:hypothetical protein
MEVCQNNIAPATILLHDLRVNGRRNAALYYYEGNFFYPILNLDNFDRGRVRKAMRHFERDNKSMVAADRARPEYQTLVQLSGL